MLSVGAFDEAKASQTIRRGSRARPLRRSVGQLAWTGWAVLALLFSACTDRPFFSDQDRSLVYQTGHPALDRLQSLFHPTLEANRKAFTGKTGPVRGFGAGAAYPQVWLRDSATLIPITRYYYSVEYIRSWLEEHLAHQQEDGSMYDWIAPGPAASFQNVAPQVREVYRENGLVISADKNTTEADQEASAVIAAAYGFRITGDLAWLEKDVGGRPLIERLDRALSYLLTDRFDVRYGLVTNAFTADWGDVSPVYPDQRAIYADEATPRVIGLYTNALFYRAAMDLSELYRRLGRGDRADFWRERAAAVRENINRHLWQESRGFYRMHRVLTPWREVNAWDDADVLALGGNALAVLYGIADDRQVGRILEAVEVRRRQFQISTIAAVLLPPYPRGFFRHPMMSEPYVYQNGGQWDWFAGRWILGEFERGYARRAYRHLVEIAERVVRNGGFYEWYTRDDRGRGSPSYAGSAAAIGQALLEGLFGIYLSHSELSLKVRLGEQSGRVHVYQPATGTYVTYRYDSSAEVIRFHYRSNFSRPGFVSLRLPQARKPMRLVLDGKATRFQTEVVGEDIYVTFSTDWKPHQVEVILQKTPTDSLLHPVEASSVTPPELRIKTLGPGRSRRG